MASRFTHRDADAYTRRHPQVLAAGIASQTVYRDSTEPVLVEQHEGIEILLVASEKFACRYYAVRKIAGEWTTSAKQGAAFSQRIIAKALLARDEKARRARIAARHRGQAEAAALPALAKIAA